MNHYFTGLNPDEAKKKFKKLCVELHPDNKETGNSEAFKRMFSEFQNLSEGTGTNETNETKIEMSEKMQNVILELSKYDFINMFICGSWLWISGNTFQIKEKLKELECKFAPNKKMWFYTEIKSSGRGNMNIEEIKNKYGSKEISKSYQKKLS